MKSKNPALFYSLAIGLLGFLLVVAKGFHFENNDDVGMFCMVKGLLQFEPTPHLFFQSSYLGYLYQWLYASSPNIEWYFVVYYFFILAGLVYVSHCILHQANDMSSKFTILLLCLLASSDVLLGSLQFTKVSIWLGFAAAIGVNKYLNTVSWKHLFIAIFFLLFGILYRNIFAVTSFGIFSLAAITVALKNSSLPLIRREGIATKVVAVYGLIGALSFLLF